MKLSCIQPHTAEQIAFEYTSWTTLFKEDISGRVFSEKQYFSTEFEKYAQVWPGACVQQEPNDSVFRMSVNF